MPRKKQIVQKQKRNRVYQAGALSGDAHKIKPKGAFRVFTNYKLFAIIGVLVLGGSFVFTALRGGRGLGSQATTSVRGEGVIRSTPEAGATNVVTGAANTIKQYGGPPELSIDPNKTYTAVFKTEGGDITVELNAKQAPTAVNNFVFLAKDGFYNGVTFFRVIADKDGVRYAQAGDPTGTGSGGPGYDLPVETTPGAFASPGVLAMAKPSEAGRLNNGSQFFFTTQQEPTLDGKDTAFGRVVNGLDVLKNLPARDPQSNANAEAGARIESITINES